MRLAEAIALGLALGADSLSVSIGIGMSGVGYRRIVKLATLFSVTQGVLLVGGANLAQALHRLLETVLSDRCILFMQETAVDPLHVLHVLLSLAGATILCMVGVNLIRDYLMQGEETSPVFYEGRLALMFLTLSVSIDAFTSGVGLGLSGGIPMSRVVVMVTAVIFAMAFAGLRAGEGIGRLIGRKAEPVGGIVLIMLAMRLISEAFR